MDTAQLKAFCAALPGAEDHEHAAPANILVYSVGGRRFAHFKTSAPLALQPSRRSGSWS